MALKDRELPVYSLSEELISSISHGVGTLLSIAALTVGVVFAVIYSDPICVVSMAIYGATLVILYTMSTLYHSLKPNNGKRVFRIIDHCSIFLLIAGTYTPLALVALRGALGWVIFGIVWGAAVLGITFNAIDLKKYAKASMVCYIATGWCIVFAMKPLIYSMTAGGIFLLVAGGVAYTLGAIIYNLGKKKKYYHSVWHFFVLIGSILQYFSILLYAVIIPLNH